MSKLSQKDKMMLMIVAAFAVLGGLYWFYVKPAKADLTAAQDRVASAQGQVDQLQQQITQISAKTNSKTGKKEVVSDQLRLAKAYPGDQDVPAAILEIEKLAARSGVTLEDATPDDGTDYAGVTGTAFTIAVKGTFTDVADFAYRMHNQVAVKPNGRLRVSGRLFAVTKVDVQAAEGGDGAEAGATTTTTKTTGPTKVTATITAIMFSRGQGGAAAAAPTTDTSAPAPTTGGPTQ